MFVHTCTAIWLAHFHLPKCVITASKFIMSTAMILGSLVQYLAPHWIDVARCSLVFSFVSTVMPDRGICANAVAQPSMGNIQAWSVLHAWSLRKALEQPDETNSWGDSQWLQSTLALQIFHIW
jgi:hypothetical protein